MANEAFLAIERALNTCDEPVCAVRSHVAEARRINGDQGPQVALDRLVDIAHRTTDCARRCPAFPDLMRAIRRLNDQEDELVGAGAG